MHNICDLIVISFVYVIRKPLDYGNAIIVKHQIEHVQVGYG